MIVASTGFDEEGDRVGVGPFDGLEGEADDFGGILDGWDALQSCGDFGRGERGEIVKVDGRFGDVFVQLDGFGCEVGVGGGTKEEGGEFDRGGEGDVDDELVVCV